MTRLIATDLDGTLLRSDGTISARTRRAVAATRGGGAEVILLTGRPPRFVRDVATQLHLEGPVVCANGGLVYDPRADTVVRTSALTAAVARRVLADLSQRVRGCALGVESADGLTCDAAYAALASWPVPEGSVREAPDDLAVVPPVKVLVRAPEVDFDELVRTVEGVVGSDGVVTQTMPGLLEVSAAGITKQTELAVLCAERGVEATDVVAFGDMPNDIPMLAWAGRAVAVANAHPDVRAVADEVTASNDDDGVARVLEALS